MSTVGGARRVPTRFPRDRDCSGRGFRATGPGFRSSGPAVSVPAAVFVRVSDGQRLRDERRRCCGRGGHRGRTVHVGQDQTSGARHHQPHGHAANAAGHQHTRARRLGAVPRVHGKRHDGRFAVVKSVYAVCRTFRCSTAELPYGPVVISFRFETVHGVVAVVINILVALAMSDCFGSVDFCFLIFFPEYP